MEEIMFYLQITTKCNMTCAHCGFSCNKNGKHMSRETFLQAIELINNYACDSIVIGGGEPTLHPDFFQFLKRCLSQDWNVWMATNGSRSKAMRRLASIIFNEDYENFPGNENDFYLDQEIISNHENKLSVALSLDDFHRSINPKISDMWERLSKNNHNFEIRNVSRYGYDRIAAAGRAKRNGYTGKNCVCDSIIIKPNGDLKFCGCDDAPIIGNVYYGIDDKWKEVIESDVYSQSNCWSNVKTKVIKLKLK
jgi:organic radical activating enzyme